MVNYKGGKDASKILGVHQRTLYQWEEKGWIKTIRTNGGKRLYDIDSYIKNRQEDAEENNPIEKINICYVRVSSDHQKEDLERQIKYMREKYPDHRLIRDIGSGINLTRKGLNKIIDLGIQGRVGEVVIAHKDRLARFGYDMIERILKEYSDAEIKIDDREEEKTKEAEMVEDVLEIMNVYVAKINGMRKYRTKNKKN